MAAPLGTGLAAFACVVQVRSLALLRECGREFARVSGSLGVGFRRFRGFGRFCLWGGRGVAARVSLRGSGDGFARDPGRPLVIP